MRTCAQTHTWCSYLPPPCTAELCLSIRSRLTRCAIPDWRVKKKKRLTVLISTFLFLSCEYLDMKRQHRPAVLHLLFNDLHHVLLPKAVLKETSNCSTDQVQTASSNSGQKQRRVFQNLQTLECWWNTRRHCKYSLNDVQRLDNSELSAPLADALWHLRPDWRQAEEDWTSHAVCEVWTQKVGAVRTLLTDSVGQ